MIIVKGLLQFVVSDCKLELEFKRINQVTNPIYVHL
jgi:hypothetical protein